MTIFAIVVLNFVLFRMMPGSPDRVIQEPAPHARRSSPAIRARWGLDKPLFPDQLVAYIAVDGHGRPRLLDQVPRPAGHGGRARDAVGPTVLLIGARRGRSRSSSACARARTRAGNAAARSTGSATALSLILYSMPYFVIGMPLIIVFAAGLRLVPDVRDDHARRATRPRSSRPATSARHLVLPLTAVTLGLHRRLLDPHALVDHRDPDRGLHHDRPGEGPRRTAGSSARHAFPNALLPMVTLIAINLGYVIAGAITAEIVFNWPGLGTLTVQALDARDYPLLQGDLPARRGVGRLRQLRSPTSCTATSTRGCARERDARDRAGAAARGAVPIGRRAPAPATRSFLGQVLGRTDGLVGLAILVVFSDPRAVPDLFVGPLADGDRPRPAQPLQPPSARATCSAPTSSGGTCST